MNWRALTVAGALLANPLNWANHPSQDIASLVSQAPFSFSLTADQSPLCTIPAGETTATCKPNARWTEILKIWKPGQGDLVCGIVETKVGDDWLVFEGRLFCVRGRAQGGTR